MQHVTLTGKEYRVPGVCACCGDATPDVHRFEKKEMLFLVVVLITKTAEVKLPYCRTCRDHATWAKGGGWLGAGLLGVVAFVGFWFVGFFLAAIIEMGWAERHFAESAKGVAVALTVALAGTGLVVWLRARKRPAGPLPRKHAAPKWAAEIVSFDKQSTRLGLHSLAFAKALLELNPGVARRG